MAHQRPHSPESVRETSRGIRQFFSPPLRLDKGMIVRGIGIRELMPPCVIERPRGTGDWLIMLFHDPSFMSHLPARRESRPPETLMIWPPGKAQFYGNPKARFCHSWIHCDGARIREIVRGTKLPVLRPRTTTQSPLFQQALFDIHNELVSHAQPDGVVIGNLLENGLRALRRDTESGGALAPIPPGLLRVRRMIGEAPAREISLREMAALAGMSASHFCARFRHFFGMPPIECLIRHRLHHAAHLLGNRSLSISEAGEMAGFPDPFHFSKMFKKRFGSSPKEYRRNNG